MAILRNSDDDSDVNEDINIVPDPRNRGEDRVDRVLVLKHTASVVKTIVGIIWQVFAIVCVGLCSLVTLSVQHYQDQNISECIRQLLRKLRAANNVETDINRYGCRQLG